MTVLLMGAPGNLESLIQASSIMSVNEWISLFHKVHGEKIHIKTRLGWVLW